MKVDRKDVNWYKLSESEQIEADEWHGKSVSERFATITYLKECVYGPEATTGRLQRVFEFAKLRER